MQAVTIEAIRTVLMGSPELATKRRSATIRITVGATAG